MVPKKNLFKMIPKKIQGNVQVLGVGALLAVLAAHRVGQPLTAFCATVLVALLLHVGFCQKHSEFVQRLPTSTMEHARCVGPRIELESELLALGDDVCGRRGCLRCYGLPQSADFAAQCKVSNLKLLWREGGELAWGRAGVCMAGGGRGVRVGVVVAACLARCYMQPGRHLTGRFGHACRDCGGADHRRRLCHRGCARCCRRRAKDGVFYHHFVQQRTARRRPRYFSAPDCRRAHGGMWAAFWSPSCWTDSHPSSRRALRSPRSTQRCDPRGMARSVCRRGQAGALGAACTSGIRELLTKLRAQHARAHWLRSNSSRF
eukprot:SAG11_NODE_1956_length_4002_cov_5.858827_2_plen_318_part_00